jgi:CheY-like chemotaxis protein
MPDSKNLLLVEDDEVTREALASILVGHGHSVQGVADGQEALDRLREGCLPDCALLDLVMPRMDGRQFRARQRQQQKWATIPVVVISGDTKVAEEAVFLGAADYLRKPDEPDALLVAIRNVC